MRRGPQVRYTHKRVEAISYLRRMRCIKRLRGMLFEVMRDIESTAPPTLLCAEEPLTGPQAPYNIRKRYYDVAELVRRVFTLYGWTCSVCGQVFRGRSRKAVEKR